jgi:hypothetical protein
MLEKDQKVCLEHTRRRKIGIDSWALLCSQSVLESFNGEWNAKEATIAPCAEPAKHQCEC